MSEREIIKSLIFKHFPNGYNSNPVSGYCHYILKNNEGVWRIDHLTSGLGFNHRSEMAIPPKYYQTPQEMYDDIKLYFNPKEK